MILQQNIPGQFQQQRSFAPQNYQIQQFQAPRSGTGQQFHSQQQPQHYRQLLQQPQQPQQPQQFNRPVVSLQARPPVVRQAPNLPYEQRAGQPVSRVSNQPAPDVRLIIPEYRLQPRPVYSNPQLINKNNRMSDVNQTTIEKNQPSYIISNSDDIDDVIVRPISQLKVEQSIDNVASNVKPKVMSSPMSEPNIPKPTIAAQKQFDNLPNTKPVTSAKTPTSDINIPNNSNGDTNVSKSLFFYLKKIF